MYFNKRLYGKIMKQGPNFKGLVVPGPKMCIKKIKMFHEFNKSNHFVLKQIEIFHITKIELLWISALLKSLKSAIGTVGVDQRIDIGIMDFHLLNTPKEYFVSSITHHLVSPTTKTGLRISQ